MDKIRELVRCACGRAWAPDPRLPHDPARLCRACGELGCVRPLAGCDREELVEMLGELAAQKDAAQVHERAAKLGQELHLTRQENIGLRRALEIAEREALKVSLGGSSNVVRVRELLVRPVVVNLAYAIEKEGRRRSAIADPLDNLNEAREALDELESSVGELERLNRNRTVNPRSRIEAAERDVRQELARLAFYAMQAAIAAGAMALSKREAG